jgi:hypothetical protein
MIVSRLSSSRSHGSADGRSGTSSLFDSGMKSNSSRVTSSASMSFSSARSATEVLVVWVIAPPSSSWVTTSLVTVLTTSGPVTNMNELSFTMKMKSVIAGE